MEQLKNKAFARKETLQPFMLVVGSLIKTKEAYAFFDEQKYRVASCLDASELTFKAFLALDCQCPKPSVRLWQFIKYAVYDIQVAGDTLTKSVKELLGSIRQASIDTIPRPEGISLLET